MSASSFWDYAQNVAQMDGTCWNCDADTRTEEPPVGAPPEVSEVIVCEGCDMVVDAN